MSFRTSLTIALALGALGLMPKASATPQIGPFLVYSGTISTSSRVSSAEDLGFLADVKGTGHLAAKFSALPTLLRTRIGTYLADAGGNVSDLVYLVTDESNMSNYAVLVVDPTDNRVISTTVSGTSLTAAEAANNFISGFKFTAISSKGGLGLFRFAFSRPTRTDPVTGTAGSYVVQATLSGPIDDLAGLFIIGARPAQNLRVVNNGVLKEIVPLPAAPVVFSPTTDDFISSMTGTIQGYYFDDTSSSSVAATTTAGSITLAFNAVLSRLANSGGGYEATARFISYIPPIMETVPPNNTPVAPTTAFQTFINNIVATYPKPVQ